MLLCYGSLNSFVVFRGCDWWSGPVAGGVCMCLFGDCDDGGVVAINHSATISLQLSALHRPPPLLLANNVKLLGQEVLSIYRKHPLHGFLFVFLYQWHMEKNPSLSTATQRVGCTTPFPKHNKSYTKTANRTRITPQWASQRQGRLCAH